MSRGIPWRFAPGPLTVGLVVALVTVGRWATLPHFTVDDAGISFSYARNLADGHGLVLEPGDTPVEAFSNPSWVLVLALARVLGLPIPATARYLGLLLGALAAGLAAALVARWARGLGQRLGWVTGLAAGVASGGGLVYPLWIGSGMETGLHAFILVITWYLLAEEARSPHRPPWSSLSLLVLGLTRPEAPLYFVAVGLPKLVVGLRSRTAMTREILWASLLGVGMGMVVLARVAYFGAPLPNSYYIKAATFGLRSTGFLLPGPEGLAYVGAFLTGYVAWPALALALLSPIDRQRRWGALQGLALLVAGLAFPLHSQGDWMPEFRFIAPTLPLLYALGTWGLISAMSRLAARRVPGGEGKGHRAPLARLSTAAVLLLAAASLALPVSHRVQVARFTTMERVRARASAIADLGRRAGLPHPTLLDPDLGGTSWEPGVRVRDLFGLGDLTLARHRWEQPLVREHLVRELRPDFIHLHGAWLGAYYLQDYPEIRALYHRVHPKGVTGLDLVAWPALGRGWSVPTGLVDLGGLALARFGPDPVCVWPVGREVEVRVPLVRTGQTPWASGTLVVEGGSGDARGRARVIPWPAPSSWPMGELVDVRVTLDAPARVGSYRVVLKTPGGDAVLCHLEVDAPEGQAPPPWAKDLDRALLAGRPDLAAALIATRSIDDEGVRETVAGLLLAQALSLAEAGDLLAAANQFTEAARVARWLPSVERVRDSLAAAAHVRGLRAMELGDLDAAFALLQAALRVDPSDARAAVALEEARGRGTLAWSPHDLLVTHLARRKANLDPSPETLHALVIRLVEARMFREATEVCHGHPCEASPEALVALAEAHRALGNLQAVLDLLSRTRWGSLPLRVRLLALDTRSLLGLAPLPPGPIPDGSPRPLARDLVLHSWEHATGRDDLTELTAVLHRTGPGGPAGRRMVTVEATSRHERKVWRFDSYLSRARWSGVSWRVPLPPGSWSLALQVEGGAEVSLGEVRVSGPSHTFEVGGASGWTPKGEAFRKAVTRGPIQGQRMVTGYRGAHLVNGYVHGDQATGRLVSSPFELTTGCSSFLIGGGRDRDRLQVRLLVGGEVVRKATGTGSERMERVYWDTSPWVGEVATVELVDEARGPWGHLLFDDLQQLPRDDCRLMEAR